VRHDGHNCPICRFFAANKPLSAVMVLTELSCAISPIYSLDAPRQGRFFSAVYHSRAPPA